MRLVSARTLRHVPWTAKFAIGRPILATYFNIRRLECAASPGGVQKGAERPSGRRGSQRGRRSPPLARSHTTRTELHEARNATGCPVAVKVTSSAGMRVGSD